MAGAFRIRPSGSSQSRNVTPTAFGNDFSNTTALSTPPLIATATRPATGGARNAGPIALATASTASVSPPTEAASSKVNPTSERSSPPTSALTIRSPSSRNEQKRTQSPEQESPTTRSQTQASGNRRPVSPDFCRGLRPLRTWVNQVGAEPASGRCYQPDTCCLSSGCWFYMDAQATRRVEPGPRRVAPTFR